MGIKHMDNSLKHLLRIGMLLVFAGHLFPCLLLAEENSESPNVLFIAVDDLRPELAFAMTGAPTAPKTKTSPLVERKQEQEFSDENGTSFEGNPAGEFTTAKSNVGTWTTANGKVLIDNKHAKSGDQCLQVAGDNAAVVLELADNLKTNGQLSFWAERWTSRAPFSFRIEKKSGGKWSEIFNGDKQVRVGRAFLSHVKVPLADAEITRLRFTVNSPPNTGILIDDLKFAPAEPMEITACEVVPMTLPALSGTEASALVKLKITTTGTLDPISIVKVKTTIGDSSDVSIRNYRPYFSGNDSNFRWNNPFAVARTPRQGNTHVFLGEKELQEGDNYLWVGCQLKPTGDLDIDNTISGSIDSVTFSNGETKETESQPSVQRMGVAVRKSGDDGVHTYRIPGLATTNAGSLIGVYDVRRDGGGDLPGNIDVGMSRSTDGGRNWEPMKVIIDMGSDPKWRGDGIGDPSVMVDRATGTIWVSATWSHGNRSWRGSGPGLTPKETGQWILVKSDDDGVTWSDPINITKQIKKPEWCFLLQGPGKGITMSDGTIVLPAQYQDPPSASNKKANRLPHSTFIYSRDHGKTWDIATGAWDDTTEAQIVELADGQLMLNCRNNRASKRAVMTTTDMGAIWKEHATHVKDLIEPGSCMASLINVGRELSWRNIPSDFDRKFLLFSNPDSLRGRNHMTIKASRDSGSTWPSEQQLLLDEQGGAGYSCMTMIDAETVGILYEGSQAHMTFQRIKIKDILNPPKNQKTKNPAFSSTENPLIRPPNSTPNRLTLSRAFGDHMVIQANQSIRIWGKAKPLASVNAQFMGKSNSTNADEKGNWLIELPAHEGYVTTGQELVVSTDSSRIAVKDILIGEVWICAGQSNMEWELRKSTNGKVAIAKANDPLLRLHNCPGGARGSSGTYSEKHMQRLWPETFSEGEWQVASPKSAASFSAVGYNFGNRLRQQLDVPVGVINVSVGGTPIESWVSAERLNTDSNLARMFNGNWLENPVLDKWCKERAAANLKRGLSGELDIPGDEFGPNHSFKPGFMHEAGIKPFAPLSIRGGLWYQGESNGDNPERTKLYDACFPLLVEDWRHHFQNENLPIAFVQLPALGRPNWPVFREYQRRSLSKLTNVGMAITIDTGHPTNVHPADKRPVGHRLAQWALVKVYAQNGTATGPLFMSHKRNGNTIELSFDMVGTVLQTSDGEFPNHFELAGDDGKFHPADAKIVGSRILLTSSKIRRPVHARYAWAAFPKPTPNLVNSEGLPASPFTTQEKFH